MPNNGEFQAIGSGRFVLVDPNKFENQYVGVKNSDLYNFSAPLEDLCISVELRTTKKNRTLLLQDGENNRAINQGNNDTGIVSDLTTEDIDLAKTLGFKKIKIPDNLPSSKKSIKSELYDEDDEDDDISDVEDDGDDE